MRADPNRAAAMSTLQNLELAHLTIERWNAGDLEGVLELYAEDASMQPGPDWPEQAGWHGRAEIRRNMEEWRAVWESNQMDLERIEILGERIVGSGRWLTQGRASGIDGTMPFTILLSFRDGKILSLEWFADHDSAVAAARDA